jgi:hypothetical protein
MVNIIPGAPVLIGGAFRRLGCEGATFVRHQSYCILISCPSGPVCPMCTSQFPDLATLYLVKKNVMHNHSKIVGKAEQGNQTPRNKWPDV